MDKKAWEKKEKEFGAELRKLGAIIPQKNDSVAKIIEGDRVIFDVYASHCVMVLLYDKDTARATIAHISDAERKWGRLLQAVINEMRSRGSKKIFAVMAGGSTIAFDDDLAIKNWQIIHDVLHMKENKDIIVPIEKELLEHVNVKFIALWIKSGEVRYGCYLGKKKGFIFNKFTIE